jgi:single-strand DNA-binding protein
MGRLTHEPELKSTGTGVFVCSFRLAVERCSKDQNGERKTDFIQCVAWRQTAEFVSKYFRRGSMIAVQGSVQVRGYEDKKGNKREAVEVVVEQASFTGEKTHGNALPSVTPEAGRFSPPQEPAKPAQQKTYQQQSMIPGHTETYSVPDFEEIVCDDDVPF